MIQPRAFHKSDLIALIVVMCAAVLVRFNAFGMTEFYDDMSELSTRAQATLTSGQLPLLGQQSGVSFPNSPVGVYIIAAMYTASTNPLAISGMIIALNIVGIALLFGIAQRYYGTIAALCAGLLYAVNPWVVFYSQRAYLQDFDTMLIIAGILLGCIGFLEGRCWAQVLFLPVFLLGVQVHLAGFALLPLIPIFIWAGRRQIHPAAFVSGCGLGLLAILPYAVGLLEWNRNSSAGVSSVLSGLTFAPGVDTLTHLLRFMTGIGLETRFLPDTQRGLWSLFTFPVGVWVVSGSAFLIGLINLWRKHTPLTLILTLWATLHLILFSGNLIEVPAYYLTTAAPGLLLIAGIGAAEAYRAQSKHQWLRVPLVALIAVVVISQSLYWNAITTLIATDLSFYTPLRHLAGIRSQLADYDDVLLIGGEGRIHRIWTWRPLLYGSAQCIREVAIAEGGLELLPAGRFAALYPPPTSQDDAFTPFYRQGTPLDLPLRPGETGYKAYLFEQAPPPTMPDMTEIAPAQFDNGVMLDGYAEGDNRLYLDWRLPKARDTDYQYFVHFLDEANERIAGHDASFYPGRYWCPNDHLILWLDLDIPAEAAQLRVGMYRFMPDGSIAAVNVITANGARSPWVDIPLAEG